MLIALFSVLLLLVVVANIAVGRSGWRRAFLALLLLANFLVALVIGSGLLLESVAGLSGTPLEQEPTATSARISLFAGSLVALALLLPVVRRGLSRLMSISPDSPVHLLALTLSVYFVAVIGPMVTTGMASGALSGPLAPLSALDLALSSSVSVVITFAGVGFVIRRSWSQTLARLKLERVNWHQIRWCVVAVTGMLALDRVVVWMWAVYLPDNYAAVQEVSTQLLGDLMTPAGAAIIGIAAGLGEEMLFRGALQPRFGIAVTAVLFALAHVQYALSPALLEVLIIGVILGLLRRKFNVTASILVHAAYNFVNVLMVTVVGGL